jgi:Holliday junction resolvase-like predicted endonuclease
VPPFVEVKTRTASETSLERPEDAVNLEKGHNPARIARRFLQQRRIGKVPWRFDVWRPIRREAAGRKCGCTREHSPDRVK